MPTHPLLIDGAQTFVTSAGADPLLKSTTNTRFDTTSPALPSSPNAEPPAVLSEAYPDDYLSTNPFDGLPAGKLPKTDSDFTRLFEPSSRHRP
ncbi:hypothetical protein DIPPA_23435 [Diplonema papillatum]|nr:hypothetical protein DIPPA_23435 [Diplonema papillatum]